jgi:hypothetical protein
MPKAGAQSCVKFVTDFLLCFLVLVPHPPHCSQGITPLKFAIEKNKRGVVALLRSAGASK